MSEPPAFKPRLPEPIRRFFRLDRPVVPVVRLEGVIGSGGRGGAMLSLARVEKLLDKAFAMKAAPAVALAVNSPGGSPVQSRLIYQRIRLLAREHGKPVLVFCEDAAASGGYLIALAGDEIFADPASILGSIGVVSASFGFVDLIKKVGVERRLKTAGAKKTLADPFSPETEDQAAAIDRIMTGLHRQFIALVKERRAERLDAAKELFDGSVYTGEEAVQAGLADGLAELRAELKRRFGEDVRLRPLTPQRAGLLPHLVGSTFDAFEERLAWARLGVR